MYTKPVNLVLFEFYCWIGFVGLLGYMRHLSCLRGSCSEPSVGTESTEYRDSHCQFSQLIYTSFTAPYHFLSHSVFSPRPPCSSPHSPATTLYPGCTPVRKRAPLWGGGSNQAALSGGAVNRRGVYLSLLYYFKNYCRGGAELFKANGVRFKEDYGLFK